jgi:hypothetical protein
MKPPSPLRERLQGLQHKATTAPLCSVGRFVSEQDEETRNLLERLLDDTSISSRQLYMELQPEPGHPDRGALMDHRKKKCRCFANA